MNPNTPIMDSSLEGHPNVLLIVLGQVRAGNT